MPHFLLTYGVFMISLDQILVVILFSLNLICLLLGYILGKHNSNNNLLNNSYNTKTLKNNSTNNTDKINIDSSKVVTKIKTDDLEKKYTSLGETKSSQENIEGSINKLKNMKG
jgi:hypothetical protein